MTIFGVVTAFCFASILGQGYSKTFCNHNLHCSESECCFKGWVTPTNIDGELRYGECKSYLKRGTSCDFSMMSCGCIPGTGCLIINETAVELDPFTLARACKTSPYVQPVSRAECNTASDCPLQSECCVKKVAGDDFFNVKMKGDCQKWKRKGETCLVDSILECGCGPGMDCLPDISSDELYPPRICTKIPDP